MRLVEDDLGAPVRLPEQPARIVSLVPNLSEALWWWRLSDRLVGATDWCVSPPRGLDHVRRVRGTKNPDVGAVVELAPDVVVADQEENREIDVRRLRDAGVSVYVTRVRGVADAADALARLADALGRAPAGIAMRQAILRAREGARRPRTPLRVACPIWRDGPARGQDETWWLVGTETFAGDLLRTSGLVPADGDGADAGRYPRVRSAALDDVDVVLLPDEPFPFGAADAEEVAARGARVRLLDGSALTWWGPRTPHAIADLARLARQVEGARRRAARRRRAEPSPVSVER